MTSASLAFKVLRDESINSLLMSFHSSQNSSAVDVKDLNNGIIPSSDDEFSILSDFSSSCCFFESSDGFDNLARPWCIHQ